MPVELLHMICGYLTRLEVASIRIMGNAIATVGLEYIATTVTLTLKEESFDRLLEIAHHPVISKYVHTLHYENDFLIEFDRAEWERNIKTPEFVAEQVVALENGYNGIRASMYHASPRAWRAFYRGSFLMPYNTYGKNRLDQAFLAYQNRCAEQDRARRSDFFSNKLVDALHHLPNLRTIHMPTHGNYSRYQTDIAKSLNGASYDQYGIQSESVAVTRSILLAVDQAIHPRQNRNAPAARFGLRVTPTANTRNSSNTRDEDPAGSIQVSTNLAVRGPNGSCLGGSTQRALRIETLILESLTWRLFLEDDKVFTIMKRAISHLTKLDIRLLDGNWIKGTGSCHSVPVDLEARKECLEKERLYEFVKSARCLEELNVSFNNWHLDHVTNVVGSFHWKSLKTVHFHRVLIDVKSVVESCLRHSSTLSKLSLGNLLMRNASSFQEKGLWYFGLTKIREATKLKEASVYGIFQMLYGGNWNMHDYTNARCASGTLIGRYLVGEGGNSSLKAFLKKERWRISEEAGDVMDSDFDYGSNMSESTSESEDSSSKRDA